MGQCGSSPCPQLSRVFFPLFIFLCIFLLFLYLGDSEGCHGKVKSSRRAAHAFRLYSFQNVMFCNDDIRVATKGPRQQRLLQLGFALKFPRQWGPLFSIASPFHSICIVCSAWLTSLGCPRDQHCSQITSRWHRWQDSGERWSGMILKCHKKKLPWELSAQVKEPENWSSFRILLFFFFFFKTLIVFGNTLPWHTN